MATAFVVSTLGSSATVSATARTSGFCRLVGATNGSFRRGGAARVASVGGGRAMGSSATKSVFGGAIGGVSTAIVRDSNKAGGSTRSLCGITATTACTSGPVPAGGRGTSNFAESTAKKVPVSKPSSESSIFVSRPMNRPRSLAEGAECPERWRLPLDRLQLF